MTAGNLTFGQVASGHVGERSSGWFPEPTSWAAGAHLTKSQMDSSGQVPLGPSGLVRGQQ